MNKNKSQTIYALYNNEEFVMAGKVDEVSDYLGVTPQSVKFYSTPTYKKRNQCENTHVIKWREELEI